MMTISGWTPARVSAVALVVASASMLAACGSATSTKASSSSSTTTPSSPAVGRGGSFNGTSGSVAAISGSSMEVQNSQSGQTTVTWTGSTKFTQTARLTLAAANAGECVTVTGTSSAGTITARSVTIGQPTSGSCAITGGLGGGFNGGAGGGPPSGAGASAPVGSAPSGSTASGTSGNVAGVIMVSGKIVSVGSTSMVVDGNTLSGFGRPRSSTSSTPTTIKAADMTIDLASSTTYTETESTTSTSLAVGDCVNADGSTSANGSVAATAVRITSAGGATCPSAFGGGTRASGAGPSGSSNG